jgi:hypothetical protein
MPVSQTEAAEALRDISNTERRSSTAYGYEKAAPHLILWGVIWFIGYGAPTVGFSSNYLFPALSLVGVIGSFWIESRDRAKLQGKTEWRYWATAVAVFFYIFALFAIMPPRDSLQIGAFFPILVSLFYVLLGIWARAPRILVTGIAIAALTLIGFFFLRQYFGPLMAVVGGGGLVLGGLWLRSA